MPPKKGAHPSALSTACGSGKADSKHKVSLSAAEKTAVTNLEKAFTESTTGALTTTEATCVKGVADGADEAVQGDVGSGMSAIAQRCSASLDSPWGAVGPAAGEAE